MLCWKNVQMFKNTIEVSWKCMENYVEMFFCLRKSKFFKINRIARLPQSTRAQTAMKIGLMIFVLDFNLPVNCNNCRLDTMNTHCCCQRFYTLFQSEDTFFLLPWKGQHIHLIINEFVTFIYHTKSLSQPHF